MKKLLYLTLLVFLCICCEEIPITPVYAGEPKQDTPKDSTITPPTDNSVFQDSIFYEALYDSGSGIFTPLHWIMSVPDSLGFERKYRFTVSNHLVHIPAITRYLIKSITAPMEEHYLGIRVDGAGVTPSYSEGIAFGIRYQDINDLGEPEHTFVSFYYKSTSIILRLVVYKDPKGSPYSPYPDYLYNPSPDWRKMTIDLTELVYNTLSSTPFNTTDNLYAYILMMVPDGMATGEIAFDHIKAWNQ